MVVELSSAGEQGLDIAGITQAARRLLRQPDIEVFIPALCSNVRADSQILVYMDGYVFIEFRPDVNYLRLRDTSFFRDVLCNSSRGPIPAYSLLDDSQLEPMRQGMESIKRNPFKPDDEVRVKSGSFKGLRCIVVDVDGETVNVRMNYRSKPLILAYTSTYLEHVEDK